MVRTVVQNVLAAIVALVNTKGTGLKVSSFSV